MEFYDDPFGFDVTEAKARKKREESQDLEMSAQNNEMDGLIKKSVGTTSMTITLPKRELGARIEESKRNNSAIRDIDLNILKV